MTDSRRSADAKTQVVGLCVVLGGWFGAGLESKSSESHARRWEAYLKLLLPCGGSPPTGRHLIRALRKSRQEHQPFSGISP